MDIEKKIKDKLDSYNLSIDDLTSEEIESLKKEIEAEDKGEVILDGVLFNIPPFRRRK